jgi:imidazolonepropionase-like amidohydrolase
MKVPALLALLLVLCESGSATFTQGSQRSPLVISNVTVIDGTGAAGYRASVVIDGERIAEIARGRPPQTRRGAAVLAGDGKYLVPGFVDLLTHVSCQSNVSGQLTDLLANEQVSLFRDVLGTDAAHAPSQRERLQDYKTILSYELSRGVTTFVDSITSAADVAALRRELVSGKYPNFLSLGPMLGYPFGHPYPTDGTDWKYDLPAVPADLPAGEQAALVNPTLLGGLDAAAQEKVRPLIASLDRMEADLRRMFETASLDGVKVNVHMPTEHGRLSPRVPFPVLKRICDLVHARGKPVFFLADTVESLEDAARAGCNVKLGPPFVLGRVDPTTGRMNIVPPPSTWEALSSSRVAILSIEANNGGNLDLYLKDTSAFEADVRDNPTVKADTRDHYRSVFFSARELMRDERRLDMAMSAISAKIRRGETLTPEEMATKAQFGSLNALGGRTGSARYFRTLLKECREHYKLPVIPTADCGSIAVFHGTLWRELVLLTSPDGLAPALMTPGQALSAVTLEAARAMRIDNRLGSIEVGKLADLLLLNSNPLTDIRNVRDLSAIIKSGREVPVPGSVR